ncbi:hypothetical protein [Clavibacter tessellarius]|uniref:hypothetical protein n=1 Tax=Clavibacter tessellarius TaxID=31965 RepID=UPI003251A534
MGPPRPVVARRPEPPRGAHGRGPRHAGGRRPRARRGGAAHGVRPAERRADRAARGHRPRYPHQHDRSLPLDGRGSARGDDLAIPPAPDAPAVGATALPDEHVA